MPLGFQRLNERQQRPNRHINFLTPLASHSDADRAIAHDFLARIAAQCYPVMKQHHLYVGSLEEHEPNPEFLGRNFNAGEVVQLVLKDKAGRWLSFRFVQMVMMHELAHCKHMNHGRAFWKERNVYAKAMEELWSKGYQGEGVWGRGRELEHGDFVHARLPAAGDTPEHLCGGAYRSVRRGRKRKNGDRAGEEGQVKKRKVTYAERQQRRIAKKFGKHGDGETLGEDDLVRTALEKGRPLHGKPTVANSKRGRELRVNAALARFEAAKRQQQQQQEIEKSDASSQPTDAESENESEDEEWARIEDSRLTAEGDVCQITDRNGDELVRVCGDEASDDGEEAHDEMLDLRALLSDQNQNKEKQSSHRVVEAAPENIDDNSTEDAVNSTASLTGPAPPRASADGSETETSRHDDATAPAPSRLNQPTDSSTKPNPPHPPSTATCTTATNASTCPICFLDNSPSASTCAACAHVLRPALLPSHWRCVSATCEGSAYVNAGDAGRCGLCGASKPLSGWSGGVRDGAGAGAGAGVMRAEVLRWD